MIGFLSFYTTNGLMFCGNVKVSNAAKLTFQTLAPMKIRAVRMSCNSVLAVFHKMYGIPKGVCFMNDKVFYRIDKDEINQQKMHLIVINRRPQYLQKSQEAAKREIERQLFKIFRTYD